MCDLCGEGWRFEATELGGPNSGRVKAVLHPIKATWENLYSQPSEGSLVLAVEDVAAEDIWPGTTGIFVSQVNKDGTRRCRFAGYIPKDAGAGGGAGTVAVKSIDAFLSERLVAGVNDPWGITITGGTLSVVKPVSPVATTPIYSVPFGGTQAGFAAFLVRLAQGNLVGDGIRGIGSLTAVTDAPNAITYDQSINWWDFKNIGQAIEELVGAENGVKYWLEPTFSNGYWSVVMHFSDLIGAARDYTVLSDREAVEYALEINAENKATRVYGLGAGSEGNTQFSIAYDAGEMDNLPEYQVTVAWKDQTVPDKLDALTRGYVADHRDPITVPSFSLLGLPDYDPDAAGFDPQKGFPGPEILQPGDTFKVSIGYGFITTRDLPVRCLGVAWNLEDGKPAERVVAVQPVIRPNLSVRTQTPAKAPAPEQPIIDTPRDGNPVTVTPWPVKGKVTNVDVDSLDEISGMEMSAVRANQVLVFNDEVASEQIIRVSLATGRKKVGFKLDPGLPSQGDPESIRYSRVSKKQVLADTGDNDLDRPTSGSNQPALYEFTESDNGGTVKARRLPIRYPGGKRWNVECLLIHPTTDDVYLVTKEDDRAQVFWYGKLSDMGTGSGDNVGQLVHTMSLKLVTDGTHTFKGKFILFRCKGEQKTFVRKASTFGKAGEIDTPSMKQSEAICAESTCAFLTTTEGVSAPIYRVLISTSFGAECGTTSGASGSGGSGSSSSKTVPGQVLNLSGWKLTLPIGSGNKPKEIKRPDLATYENKPYFYTDDGTSVVFQAPVNGVTTSGSSYPRSELRQMEGNGDETSWSNKNQTWTMEADMAFTHLPGTKPHCVGLQIHDSNDDVTVLRLEGNNLYVTRGDETHYDLIDGSYTLGDRLKVKVVAKAGGGIDWYFDGVKKATVPGTYSGCYFKAGVYPQANEDNGTGYGQTRFYGLKVRKS